MQMINKKTASIFLLLLLFFTSTFLSAQKPEKSTYTDFLNLFHSLRILERPTLSNGVPDYTSERCGQIKTSLSLYQKKLSSIDTSLWTLNQKVDFELLKAEMNAIDFNLRILQPWVRDPAFYGLIFNEQSDTPAHEGPTSFAAIDIWDYAYPLSKDDSKKLTDQLKVIPPLLDQAKKNLTGNARDLWLAGTDNIKDQITYLDELSAKVSKDDKQLNQSIIDAKSATENFIKWLELQSPKKNGPSGIGKENYTWNLQHVLLIPLTWEEEVAILKRELARAYSSLQLEREHNKNLPELKAFSSQEEFSSYNESSVSKLMNFLKDKQVLPVSTYMEPELRKHLAAFQPNENKRNFFSNIIHKEPAVLYSHSTHWFEIARIKSDPNTSLLRREPLPFNLWMTRSEGLATSMEETFMKAGLWDENPRAKELVWIMLAQRCARGLASLYAQANEIDYKQAREFQVEWTPKGWTGDVSLVGFEQHLYLRQPGYGSSYVTGKYQLEQLVMDASRQHQNDFKLYTYFDELYSIGVIPISLVRWQMTGLDNEIKKANDGK